MRKLPPIFSLAALVLTIGACSTHPAADEHNRVTPALGPTTSNPGISIVGSTPAELPLKTVPGAGQTVKGPVNVLTFDFGKPVILSEVIVTGPDGKMPMMLSSAGQQQHFEIPLPGLLEGDYQVEWRASLSGIEKAGSFAFTVK